MFHYHTDHIGTPREITNSKPEVVWSARFKTYGALALAAVTEVDNPLRFQGQYCDEETGLHYNRHRYYDPECGQFTTQDPIGLLGGMNAYQYAPNPLTQFWNEVNRPFLDEAISRGDDIALATRPTADVLFKADNSLTGYGREIKHLSEAGYEVDPRTGYMTKN